MSTSVIPEVEASAISVDGGTRAAYASGPQQSTLNLVPENAWFFDHSWQAGEAEAENDIKAGRLTFYESDEAFIGSI